MLSINTNLSSLIAQNSMSSATKLLNQAVERMTTGYKINQAKDNAANYSISTNLTTKINAYMVAEDNCAMGLDMLNTANGSLDQISDKLTRLRDLQTQASNGTYGATSLNAINAEANALVDEINRLYQTAEYNGQKIFKKENPHSTEEAASTFSLTRATVKDYYTNEEIAAMKKVSDVNSFTNGETYSISTAEELAKLATLTNATYLNGTTNTTFVLANDIDLKEWCETHESEGGWTPIGKSGNGFWGDFNGNGHTISNLTIENESTDYQGLFGKIVETEIRNLTLKNVEISGKNYVGGIAGGCSNSYNTFINCHVEGNIKGTEYVGGIIGSSGADAILSNCSVTGNITGNYRVGGLTGYIRAASIQNCFSTSNIIGTGDYIGGLIGKDSSYEGEACEILNSYSTGNIQGNNYVGGLIGSTGNASVYMNCYATGNVTGNERVGGFVGSNYDCLIQGAYATGDVQGNKYVGGFVGQNCSDISNSFATGDVNNTGDYTGGFAGSFANSATISNSFSTGKVTSSGNYSDGFAGDFISSLLTNNATTQSTKYSSGVVTLSAKEIQEKYSFENMGFTEENGWTIVNGTPLLSWQKEVDEAKGGVNIINLQVGINSEKSSMLSFNIAFILSGLEKFREIGLDLETDYLTKIDEVLAIVSEKQTEYGAAQNRLESALESIAVNIENLTSSRSTIRDADIAKVSSEYIRQQILQQASATLLSTANQSPSIALQLI